MGCSKKFLNKLSKEANEIVINRQGYRNNNTYGNGVEDFEEILKYEVLELCNNDIFRTTKNLYNIKLDLRRRKEYLIDLTLRFYKSQFKTSKLYGKWFARKEDVIRFYSDRNLSKKEVLNEISVYLFRQKFLVASDLGNNGVLLVSNKPFRDIYGFF